MYFRVQTFFTSSGGRLSQQELAQSMSRAVLILPGVLARSHQVAQGLMGGIGNPHRRQINGATTARQFRGVAAICLHPVAWFHWYQTRRHRFTSNTQSRQLPIQHVTGRTSFRNRLSAA
jgi:hypothetical protein